jgi:hemoglobin
MRGILTPKPTDAVQVNGVSFSHDDIFGVVDSFYRLVAIDELLKTPFASVHDWPNHIEKMTHFWWFKFGGELYLEEHYDPVTKHFAAGFNAEFLERWLGLFQSVLASKLRPEQSELWKALSFRMGQALYQKNEMYKDYLEKERAQAKN